MVATAATQCAADGEHHRKFTSRKIPRSTTCAPRARAAKRKRGKALPRAGGEKTPQAVYSTQEDPIGLAGGLNLYGYAAGDPINNSDPFGLCPDSLSTEEREECERREDAERQAHEQAVATCKADAFQAVVNFGLHASGIGVFNYVKSGARVLSEPAAAEATSVLGLTSAEASFFGNAALLPAGAALRAGGPDGRGGSSNPFAGGAGLLYAGAKVTPFASLLIDTYEATSSCMGAAGITP